MCEQYLSANNVMPSVFPWKADWNRAFNVISWYQMSVKDMLDFFWDSVNGDLQYTLRGDWVKGGWKDARTYSKRARRTASASASTTQSEGMPDSRGALKLRGEKPLKADKGK